MPSFEYRDDALSACRADRNQSARGAGGPVELCEQFRETCDDPAAGRGERVAGGERAAVHVQLRQIDRAQRAGQAELRAAVFVVLPRGERAQHLRGKCFVNLVEVEVLQRQAGTREHARHRVGGRHQQAFLFIEEVDCSRFRPRQIREHRQAAFDGPRFAREQHRRCAVGERRRIAGRQRAGVAIEYRFQAGQLFERQIGAQVVVAREAAIRRHQVVEETAAIRVGELAMAVIREFVLRLARNRPALRHQFAVLAHRKTRARFAVARQQGLEKHLRPQLRQRADALAGGLAAIRFEQDLAHPLVDADRCIRRRIDAARDARFDLPECNLVRDENRRFEAGAARLLHVVSGRFLRQGGGQH